MRQHTAHDATGVEYTGALESVWSQWEPVLCQVEHLLRAGFDAFGQNPQESGDLLRRIQYRAHTASEFASGLRPPLAAVDAHDHLVEALTAARDALALLAVRATLDELDDTTTQIGLQTLATTRDAFGDAQSSGTAAYRFTNDLEPIYVQPYSIRGKGMGLLLWALICLCVVLFTVLLFEVFLLTAPA